MQALAETLPAFLAWAVGFAVVALGSWLWLRGTPARGRAVLLGQVAAAVPVAFWTATRAAPAGGALLLARWPGLAGEAAAAGGGLGSGEALVVAGVAAVIALAAHIAVVGISVYLSQVVAAGEVELVPPSERRPVVRPTAGTRIRSGGSGSKAERRAPPHASRPSPRPYSTVPAVVAVEPRLAPPPGTVASASSGTRDDEIEEAGLLRVLDDGPDFQRQAAARALAIPFANSGQPRVVAALLAIVGRDDCSDEARAEAYIAARGIEGSTLSWEDEVVVRQRFPEGVDSQWVERTERACVGALMERADGD